MKKNKAQQKWDKRKIAGMIGRLLFLGICSLIIGIRIYSWNAKNLMHDGMPMPFGYGAAVVLSGSMEPELSVDDLVLVKKSDSYRKGDIVVYQVGESLVIHRIVSITDEEVITKGDANNTEDEPIKLKNIKGKAVSHFANVGTVASALRSNVGFIVLIVIVVLLFELPYFMERKKAMEEQEKIKEEIRKLRKEKQEG